MQSEEKKVLENIENHLGSLLNEKKLSSKEANLKNVFNRLSHLLGCSFELPTEISPLIPKEDLIDRICRKSKVHYKTTPLASLLQQSCPFPLLGFFKEGERPVLLKIEKGKCQEILSNQIRRKNINPDLLDPTVYLFFRPLPKEASYSILKITKKILQHYSKETRVIFLTGFFSSVFSLIFAFSINLLFGTILSSGSFSLFAQLFFGLFLIVSSSCFFNIIQGYTLSRLRSLAIHDVQLGLWGNLFRSSSDILKKWSVGEIFEKVDYFSRNQIQLSEQVITALVNTLFSFVYFLALFYFNFSLALISFGILALIIPILTFITFLFLKYQREFLLFNNLLISKIVQYIRGIRTIRTTHTQSYFFFSWAQTFIPTQKLIKKTGRMRAFFTTISQNTPSFITLIVYFILILGSPNALSVGSYIAFLSVLSMFVQSTYSAFNYFYDFIALIPSWNQAKEIALLPSESSFVASQKIQLKGKLQLDNIDFSYDENKPLLKEINLTVNPGEFIGIIGATGSGKSTLFRLLLGLEIPKQGRIIYDDIDLKNWDLIDLRSQIGSVLQNNIIFEGSLLENISLGRKCEEKILENILDLSHLKEFIESLPMGLQTLISYGGNNISQGQKQRILIARALFNQPKLLLLDEVTSALDAFSQRKIFSGLSSLGITTLAITHRQETLHYANRLFFIGENK